MNSWASTKARRILAALLGIGWQVKRQSGSHRVMARNGWSDVVFAFHDDDGIGPRMLSRIAKRTGFRPTDIGEIAVGTHGAKAGNPRFCIGDSHAGSR